MGSRGRFLSLDNEEAYSCPPSTTLALHLQIYHASSIFQPKKYAYQPENTGKQLHLKGPPLFRRVTGMLEISLQNEDTPLRRQVILHTLSKEAK